MYSGVARPTYDDVNLLLKLYDLRREGRLREARRWFAAVGNQRMSAVLLWQEN